MEDPELYRTRTHSRTEERLRRKMVRQMIAELPGKLDHASVVAYKVGRWYSTISNLSSLDMIKNTDNETNLVKDTDFFSKNAYQNNNIENPSYKSTENHKNTHLKMEISNENNCVSTNCSLNLKRNCQKANVIKV